MLVTSTRAATLDGGARRLALEGAPLSGSAARTHVPLSMYAEAPVEELTLDDFEVLAFERMKVLKSIDMERSRGVKPRELDEKIKKLVREHIGVKLEDPAVHRRDQVSHHILRLAYCDTEDKRRWFLTQEVLLFKWRLEQLSPEQVSAFLAHNDMQFQQVTEAERAALLPQLKMVWDAHASFTDASAVVGGAPTPESVEYYKLPFQEALDLVRARSVVLYGGYAFVPRTRLTSIICGRYRAYLSRSLMKAATVLGSILGDERLKPVLSNMAKAYMGPEYGLNGKRIVDAMTADSVDALALSAFPLCMHKLHEALKAKHKLKHWGRLQYGLFLKGLNLPMEEAMEYFKREFTRGMPAEEFIKRYAYNVRHMYGKEGKRTDYTPYSCVKIITGTPPGADEDHGCPYRHWDINRLRSALGGMHLPIHQVDSILDSVRTRDYQVACRKQFEARFVGADSGMVGNHPNAYVEAAVHFLKHGTSAPPASPSGALVGGGGGAVETTPGAATTTSVSPSGMASPDTDLTGLDATAFDFDNMDL